MHITNIFHLLNEQGDIPSDMRPQAKKMAGFLVMVIDAATTMQSEDFEDTGLRCQKRGCHGHIMALIVTIHRNIHQWVIQQHLIVWKAHSGELL